MRQPSESYIDRRTSRLAVDLSLDELLRKLRRRKWLISAFVAFATLLTVGSLLLTSRYTATAGVLVADRPAILRQRCRERRLRTRLICSAKSR